MTTTKEAAGLVAKLRVPKVKNRRYYDQAAFGRTYKEGDRDFTQNNMAACVWFLKNRDKITTLLAQMEGLRRERDAARAGIAEAVKVCEPFKNGADRYDETKDPFDDEDWAITMLGHLRAARAFVEKHK
ncbi:hypothetical protein ACN6KF_003005 [Labrys sp. La1]|uniref:hypothetical protein n=1 Tax=Labrys sp. La1 TaxID=3404917 RepID=UPI003EC02B0B